MTTDIYIGQKITQTPELPHDIIGTEMIPIGRSWQVPFIYSEIKKLGII